jgi:hypothetical protein
LVFGVQVVLAPSEVVQGVVEVPALSEVVQVQALLWVLPPLEVEQCGLHSLEFVKDWSVLALSCFLRIPVPVTSDWNRKWNSGDARNFRSFPEFFFMTQIPDRNSGPLFQNWSSGECRNSGCFRCVELYRLNKIAKQQVLQTGIQNHF